MPGPDIVPSLPAEGDSVSSFAIDLRALRSENGEPTLKALETATGVSKSVIADAFAGRRLPTERTVRALVENFGVDARPWLVRRDALATPAAAAAGVSPDGVASGSRRRPRLVTLRTTILIAAATAIVAGVASAGIATALAPAGRSDSAAATTQSPAPTPRTLTTPAVAATGDDPAATPCVDDAVVAASATRARKTQLQIVYSAKCNAAWARISRYDDDANGQSVSARIYVEADPTADSAQSTTEPDSQSAYTTLIARSSTEEHLCATGSITVAGKRIDMGAPVCL